MKKPLLAFFFTFGIHLLFLSLTQGQGFEKRFGGESPDAYQALAQTSDGGYIMAGNTSSYGNGGNDVFIVKTNATGTLQWSRVIGGAGDDLAYAVAVESNGNIIIAGQTNSFGSGGNDVYLIKLNAFGKLLWTKTFGGAGTDYAKGVLVLNGKYFITGATSSTGAGGTDVYLIKTDTSGSVLLSKTYGYAGDDYANAITATSGGNLVLAGRTSNFGVTAPVYVLKIKTDGDTLWTRNFNENNGSQSSVKATAVAELNDLSYLVTGNGFPYNGGYGNMFHLKIDGSGNKVYSSWSGLLSDYGNSVTKTSDGGYVISTQYCNYGCRIRLIKYSSTGSMVWQHDYLPGYGLTYAEFSNGYAVTETSDKGFAVAGYTNWTSGAADALLVKTDSAGNGPSNPVPVITANGPTSVCSGTVVTLSAPAGYSTYQWIRYSGNSMFYLDKTVSLPVSTTGTYYCVMSDYQGIYVSGTLTVSVYSTAIPTVTANGPTSFCYAAGQSLTLSAPGGYTYQWKLNGTAIPGETTNTYAPTTAGNISVECTNICGTFNTTPLPVNPAAIPVVQPVYCYSGNCDVYDCNANSPELRVNNLGTGITYTWQVNGTTVQSGTSYSYYPPAAGLYTCIVSSACGSDSASGYTVNYIPQAPFSITPSTPTSGCGLTNAVLNSPYSITGVYEWYYYGNPIPGATNAQYIATASGDYSVAFSDYFCGYSFTDPLTVNLFAGSAPFITATGPTQICSGTVTLNAGITGPGITWVWYKDFVQIPGAFASSHVASQTGSYTCYIYNPVCGGGWSNSLEVVIGIPSGNATLSSASICSGNTTTASFAPARTGYAYQWKLNGTVIPGATSSSYTAGSAGNYLCTVTNTCGTMSSNSVSLTVNSLPPATATPQGSTALCPLASLVLSANAGAGLSYQWYKNNASQSGATAQNYTVTTAGNYKVRVTNAFGCTSFSSPDISVTSITIPVASAKALDYPRICSGTSVSLKAGTAAGYYYQWKKNGVILNGATDSVYQAGASGTYTVTTSNACGTATSSPIAVTQVSSPSPVVTPAGSTTFCTGGSVLLQVNATTGSGYQWKKNGSFIPGATGATFAATTTGNYKAVKTNQYGCSGTSASTAVTVNSNPSVAITAQGPTTFCAGDSVQLKSPLNNNYSYQWKKNNVNVNGATTNKFQAKAAGSYKLKATNNNGCSSLSNAISVSVPCRAEGETMVGNNTFDVKVFPNPSSESFTLEFVNHTTAELQIRIYDITGRLILQKETTQKEIRITKRLVISGETMEAGIYSAVVVSGSDTKILKIIRN